MTTGAAEDGQAMRGEEGRPDRCAPAPESGAAGGPQGQAGMSAAFVARASDAIAAKSLGHFSTHGLGEVLAEMGAAHDQAAVRALTRRLVSDEEYGLVEAIAAGLRETAAHDDEFVRMASAAADMVRYDIAEGPVIRSLISVGSADPDAAVPIAEDLVKTGDADYAAFLIGGAYSRAAKRCDDVIESLASSDDPSHVAAALRSLRVAHIEHGAPGAGRIADAVDTALRVDDDDVHREAMEALLDIHVADRERTGPMIRELAMRRHVCKPILATCVSLDPPFDDDACLEYLDICIEGVSASDRDVVHSAYRSLERLAGFRPDRAARILAKLAERGAYVDSRARPVIEELWKKDPEVAAEAITSLLKRALREDVDGYLPSMVEHASRFSDPAPISEAIAAALESEPSAPRRRILEMAALRVSPAAAAARPM